jgi:hypothetical protein
LQEKKRREEECERRQEKTIDQHMIVLNFNKRDLGSDFGFAEISSRI